LWRSKAGRCPHWKQRLGQEDYDEGRNMTTVTWTKCSDRMPPVDSFVILRNVTDKRYSPMRRKNLSSLKNKDKYEWTQYTLEAWEELNK